jgi:aminoglycoside phosphotransferase (APT) family kinase protein
VPAEELLSPPDDAAEADAGAAWSVVRELLFDGVLTEEDIVDGNLSVRDVSSRSPCFIVTSESGRRCFVKDVGRDECEGRRYLELARRPAMRPFIPEVIRTREGGGLLVTVVDDGAEDLWSHHLTTGRFPRDVGGLMGEALAALHREKDDGTPAPTPFALRARRPHLDVLPTLEGAAIDVIRRLQSDAALATGLDRVAERWAPSASIHGDLKWPNVVVARDRADAITSIRLVDWEHSGAGDPGWDVGSAMAAYVSFWLWSLQPPSEPTARSLVRTARFPLSDMRPAMEDLWATYLVRADVEDPHDFRARVAAHAAARLVQTALESASGDAMGAAEVLHLQVASNILADPAAAAVELLGLAVPRP